MLSPYLHFLRPQVKTTHVDATIFKTVTLTDIASAHRFNFVNNEYICGKKTIL
jgi:hypothetical protein